MSALTQQNESPFRQIQWQADVVQLLDEHHLVAWSKHARLRLHFASSLGQFLERQGDTEVCVLYGRFIDSLEAFCYQLERAIPGPVLERRIDGLRGVTALLRSRQCLPGQRASRFRYYVWHDADVLLRRDHRLFGQIVDTLAGVAAESEYANDDLLLLHRAVFVGGPVLDVYASDSRGQFRSWCADDCGEPFWEVVTGVQAPPFVRYAIDQLGRGL